MPVYDPVQLEVLKHLFASVADEMGIILRRSAYSPNIKERRDFSCAVFDASGQMIAQAAHIPVHLGSMPLSVLSAIEAVKDLGPGDMVVLNDPYRGGTHLPDITLVAPVYFNDPQPKLVGYVACRAHHADIGGMSPGSMPIARELFQEGLIIPPVRLITAEKLNQEIFDLILANVRTPHERAGDLWAQVAANRRGIRRMKEITVTYGLDDIHRYMRELLAYTERITRRLLASIPAGEYTFEDYLDDDGISDQPIPIRVTIEIFGDEAVVDFTGSSPQVQGSLNAVYAITLSAVYYAFRCLIGLDVPNNSGCLAPIRVIAPAGSVVNALAPAPVAGGNVETSQRLVDVIFGALAKAVPGMVPAASQGTMNNVTIGGWDKARGGAFTYYETIGGGHGASQTEDGQSALHSHMTNTLNTPIEALEYSYPLRIRRYAIRRGSGGAGFHTGGDGICREIEILSPAQTTIISERRRYAPYGLQGGSPGQAGENILVRDGVQQQLGGKAIVSLKPGDVLSICTPGGGGYGEKAEKG